MLKPSPRNHDPQNALIPKRRKIMDREEEAEDRISSLPDCLLLEIISRLRTTKHAIKTSTLSKRWQHLWTLLPNLIFIAHEDDNKRGYYDHHELDGYFSFIDKTLPQCPTHVNLNKFELKGFYSDFNTRYKSQINSWIRYAITRNVQEVNLELLDRGKLGRFRYDDDFFFKNLCATRMKLTSCVLIYPFSAISWEKLKWLCISKAILDEDAIADILSGSPCLETLELDNCFGFKSINITSKSVKNLVFSHYVCTKSWEGYYLDSIITSKSVEDSMFSDYLRTKSWGSNYINSIKINAPYILSLTIEYNMGLRELLLLNVSSLVKADLHYWLTQLSGLAEEEFLKGLLQSLGHVKKITLGNSNLKVLSRLEAKGFQFFEGADDSD